MYNQYSSQIDVKYKKAKDVLVDITLYFLRSCVSINFNLIS